jgi:hypothetical protein
MTLLVEQKTPPTASIIPNRYNKSVHKGTVSYRQLGTYVIEYDQHITINTSSTFPEIQEKKIFIFKIGKYGYNFQNIMIHCGPSFTIK